MFSTSLRHATKLVVALSVGLGGTATALAGTTLAAPAATASTPCVYQTIGINNTYQRCVVDLQILLNNPILKDGAGWGYTQRLAVDGYYGPETAGDVEGLTLFLEDSVWDDSAIKISNEMTPAMWRPLCGIEGVNGFEGVYWHDLGCAQLD